MPAKKRFIPVLIFILILLSACSPGETAISPEKSAKEKGKVLDLLASDDIDQINKAIDKIETYDLQADPEIGSTLVGLIGSHQDEVDLIDFVFRCLDDIPEGNFPELNQALLEQFESASAHGQAELQDQLINAIMVRDFTPDYEQFKYYYEFSFEHEDGADFNGYMLIGSKFAGLEEIELILERKLIRPPMFNWRLTNESALKIFIEYLDRLIRNGGLSKIECENMSPLFDAASSFKFNVEKNYYVLNAYELGKIGAIFTDKVWIDEELSNKCKALSIETIENDMNNVLMLSDPNITRDFYQARLAYFDDVILIDEFGTGKEYSQAFKTKYAAIWALTDISGEEKNEFLHDYFMNNYENDGYLINRMLIIELISKGYIDIAPQIASVIESIHDLDWHDIQWVNGYDFGSFVYDFDPFETSWSDNVGLLLNHLYALDPQLAFETISLLINDDFFYDYMYSHPSTEEFHSMRDIELPLGNFKNDTIVRYIIELVRKNNIETGEDFVTGLKSQVSNEIGEHRIRQIFRELDLEKEETAYFYAKLLDSDNSDIVFNVARMLQDEFEVGPQFFTPYYESEKLEVIAGAYEHAGEMVDKELIIEAMNAFGDIKMASHFLNDHDAWLSQASQEWGEAHGYEIIEFNF